MTRETPEREPRVLVVDDNVTTASFICDMLDEAGVASVLCHNGGEAVARASSEAVDLVVLDVMLPDMDGPEVARQIKENAGPDEFIPVIMLSALCSEEDKLKGLEHADDYVTKPFSRVELLARIKAFMRIRREHAALLESRRLYQRLHDQAPFMYLSLDSELRVASCNAAFLSVVDRQREEVLGKTFESFFPEDDRLPLGTFLAELESGEGAQHEARFSVMGGGSDAMPAHVGMRAVRMGSGDDSTTVVVMQDETRKVQLEEEQRLARRQLYRSARLTSLGMLASGVAHELNNPLTAILGFSSALLDRLRQNEELPRDELQEYLGVINTETLRCRDVIEALSGFALDREVAVVDISLQESVRAAVRLLLPRAQKHRLTIENTVDEDVYVRADSSRLGQAIVNVIANAIDFCEGGGTLKISVDLSPPGNPGFVALRMSDDGPGIPADIQSQVFDPFFTTKEVGKGTGLGLTMCHSIMKDCGGSIDIVSEPGQGTTVVFDIPRATA